MSENAGDNTPEQAEKTVLRRKLSSAEPGEATAPSRLLLRALRRSLARAAGDLCELPLAVIGATQKECSSDDVTDHLSDEHLLMVLDGPKGFPGALSMDAAAVTATIQQQTMGQVSGPAPAQRHYTGTDAAMIAPLINMTMERAERALVESPEQPWVAGFRFGARAEDARSLGLLLEADTYQVITLSLDLAVGRMQGTLCLVLPDVPEQLAEGEEAAHFNTGPNLGDSSGVMRAELTAVLTRIQLSLDDLVGLRPGDTLPLAAAALNATELHTIEGEAVAHGRLGQASGARAIRLHAPGGAMAQQDRPAGDFAAHMGADIPPPTPQQETPRKLVTAGTADDPLMEPMAEIEDDMLNLEMNPDQVAAEITELAGLDFNPEEAGLDFDPEEGGLDFNPEAAPLDFTPEGVD